MTYKGYKLHKWLLTKIIFWLLPYSAGLPITLKQNNYEIEKGIWLRAFWWKGESIMVEKL